MTLQEFVEHGTVATHAQREAFETGMLQGLLASEQLNLAVVVPDLDEAAWEETFAFWRQAMASLGVLEE